jgi:hypothetical protein
VKGAPRTGAVPGVALEGGRGDAFLRERASATPQRHASAPPPAPQPGASIHAGLIAQPSAAAHTAGRAPPLDVPLAALQRWFAAVIMHPDGVEAGIAAHHAAAATHCAPGDVEQILLPSSKLTGVERIAIYAEAYRARLVECLADDYPALKYALGDDAFEALCLRYVARHPSESPNLNAFGRHMAVFCRTEEVPPRRFEGDLAALEWAMVEVLHAAQPEKLDLATLATVPPDRWAGARFAAGGAVRVLELDYPVNAFFQAFRHDEGPDVPAPAWSATAVFRDGTTIWRMDLSRAMHALLVMLSSGTPLGAALDTLAASGRITEEEGRDVMVWFRDWVRHGFFARIEID